MAAKDSLSRLVLGVVGIGISSSVSLGFAVAHPGAPPYAHSTASIPAAKINATQIRKILDEIQAAAKRRDTATIIKYLAPNAVINFTVRTAGKKQSMRLTRQQYAQYLQQGFDLIQDYRSSLSNVKVQVTPNGRTAYATYTLVEETTLRQPAIAMSSSSVEVVRFDLIQNQLLATDLQSLSTVEIKQ